MGKIRQCVKDVHHIINESEDFEQAKRRIRQLLVEERRRESLAVAQRVRDQLSRIYDDEPADARVCLDQVLSWLDSEHLTGRRHAVTPLHGRPQH
jgi:hypothetical protein